ncbi:MAG: metallophosphoesterase [Thermoactinomyces sp.]
MPVIKLTSDQKLTRRAFLKKGMASGAILALLGLSGYSFFVEKNHIELSRIRISSPRLPASFRYMKILHISDLHYGFFYDLEQLDQLVETIAWLSPDMICFTGDFVDQEFTESEAKNAAKILKRLPAPDGKFAVLGNHDYLENVERVKNCLANSGFRLLINERNVVRRGQDAIYISGMDDLLAGTPEPGRIFEDADLPDFFHILLAHEPDFATEIKDSPVDLQLSGHSHGGQVNLPFMGPLITPPLSRVYPSGLYKINQRLTLYTNRGLGTTILPFRFCCRPEIAVIELV